jgi:exosortase E/protease (VPEID-CTERM system)
LGSAAQRRVVFFAVLFAAEVLVATVLLDGKTPVPPGAWLTAAIHHWGARAARYGIGFAALYATLAYLRYAPAVTKIAVEAGPVRRAWLAGHVGALAAFSGLSLAVYGTNVEAGISNLASAAWLAAVALAILCGALAYLRWDFWRAMIGLAGWLWAYAAVAVALAGAAESVFRSWWRPAARLTFSIVSVIARPFVGALVVDQAALKIGTRRFTVVISDQCSGLEGIGLLLVFGIVWLVIFRDELRLPNALVMFPVSIVTLFLMNSARITAMILIGNAGARDIAAGGFHSQAGWLSFNAVAFGLVTVARRVPWIALHPPARTKHEPNMTAACLVPFLCALVAGMLARATSGTFEWLYGARVAAAAGALWVYRREYAKLDWRADWLAPLAGVAAFAVWIVLERPAPQPMPAALAAASVSARYAWIAMRVLGAVVTVPVVEELAFRAYLLRRFVAADFEAVPLTRFTWFSLTASSLAFGALHGGRFLSGTLAGLVFGLAMLHRGRLGSSVIAHAAANLLLAALVLTTGAWQYW